MWSKSVRAFALAVGEDGAFFVQSADTWLPGGDESASGAVARLPEPLLHADLHAAWAGREDAALIAGDAGGAGVLASWDGRTWTLEPAGDVGPLHAVLGVPELGNVTYFAAVPLRSYAASS